MRLQTRPGFGRGANIPRMLSLDAEAIHAIRQALQDAENAFDGDAAAFHLSDDAVLMVPDFAVQEGRDACASFLRDTLGWLKEHFDRHVTYESAEVSVLGDIAFDRGTFAFRVVPRTGGEQSLTSGKYLWLLRRTDGHWKVTRIIVSRDDQAEGGDAQDC